MVALIANQIFLLNHDIITHCFYLFFISKIFLLRCSFLLKHNNLALPALQICLGAFTWTDGEAVTKVSSFCAALVVLAVSTRSVELQEFVSKDLFSAIIQGLALESNAIISADLVGLCREIFIYLCDRDPAPRQVSNGPPHFWIFWHMISGFHCIQEFPRQIVNIRVAPLGMSQILLMLPSITHQDLLAFEEALTKTSSPKEQKQHMKSLLLVASGNKLKALAAQKSVNVITNVSSKHSNPTHAICFLYHFP